MKRADLVLALALSATVVSAHGLDSGQGSVVVRSDRVEVALEVDAERTVTLVIRDEEGTKLPGRIASARAGSTGHVLLELEYALARPPRWLSFRLAEDGWSASRPRRLVLSVRDASPKEPRLVTLTSGGNVETLGFAEAEPAPTCGPALLDHHPECLREVMAFLNGARLDVVLPLGVLESWIPLPRADPDFLGVAEQHAARRSFADLVASRVHLVAEDGPTRPSEVDVVFLGLDDAALGPAPEARSLDAWTARVRVSLLFDRPGRLHWDLFNPRVTTARVVVLDGEGCAERRLSTYDPRL